MTSVAASGGGELEEARLLARARQGDGDAFGVLVGAYRGELHAHCYRMLGSYHDAEDALQDALVKAWRGLAGFEGRSSLRAWLYKVATNAALDVARRRSNRELPTFVCGLGARRPYVPRRVYRRGGLLPHGGADGTVGTPRLVRRG
jgi:RNA polymerase sigma-70 factor, ECF subfamily